MATTKTTPTLTDKTDMRELFVQDEQSLEFFRSLNEEGKREMLQQIAIRFKQTKDKRMPLYSASTHFALIFMLCTFSERELAYMDEIEKVWAITEIKFRPV